MGSSKNILMAFMLIAAFSTSAFSMDDEYSDTERFVNNAMKIGTVVERTYCPNCRMDFPTAWFLEERRVSARLSFVHSCKSKWKDEQDILKKFLKTPLHSEDDSFGELKKQFAEIERMKMLRCMKTYEEKTPVFNFDFNIDIPQLTESIIKSTPQFTESTESIISSASLVFDQASDPTRFDQVLSRVGALTKNDVGTLTLLGNNSYFSPRSIDLSIIELANIEEGASSLLTPNGVGDDSNPNDCSSPAQDRVNDRKEEKE